MISRGRTRRHSLQSKASCGDNKNAIYNMMSEVVVNGQRVRTHLVKAPKYFSSHQNLTHRNFRIHFLSILHMAHVSRYFMPVQGPNVRLIICGKNREMRHRKNGLNSRTSKASTSAVGFLFAYEYFYRCGFRMQSIICRTFCNRSPLRICYIIN